MNNFIESVKNQFKYYKLLGDKTFSQLSNDQLFWQYNRESNSIAVIIKHLWGNMLSRWTDFLSSDGEKPWRDREAEFAGDFKSREELIEKWEAGWQCLFDALDMIKKDEDLERIIYIRNMGHTVAEAINRQMAHYAYHVGQIVYIGKMIKAESWQSLSIPKGKSETYNTEKFSQPKDIKHFTKEFLKEKK